MSYFTCPKITSKQPCFSLPTIPQTWIKTALTTAVIAFAVFVVLPNFLTIQTAISAAVTVLKNSLGTLFSWAALHPGVVLGGIIVTFLVIAIQKLPIKVTVQPNTTTQGNEPAPDRPKKTIDDLDKKQEEKKSKQKSRPQNPNFQPPIPYPIPYFPPQVPYLHGYPPMYPQAFPQPPYNPHYQLTAPKTPLITEIEE